MDANALLQALTQALFVVIFLVVAVQSVRRPLRATIDIALLFGAVSLVIAEGLATALLDITPSRVLQATAGALVMTLPYLLLRLVDDFSDVPRWLMRGAEAGLALAVTGLFAWEPALPAAVTLLYVLYFFGLEAYAAVAFVREASRSRGVTRRRMQAVAIGSLLLGLTIFIAGLQAVAPGPAGFWSALSGVTAFGSGLGYFFGFAPPPVLRRAWQEPELRAFLGRAASLPRLPHTSAIVAELERGAAAALGAAGAGIGLWDESRNVLVFSLPPAGQQEASGRAPTDTEEYEVRPGEMAAGRAFALQQPLFYENALRDDPAYADVYRRSGVIAVLVAPITAGSKRLGVLAVYASHPPIFAEDDLVLVRLLADQAAVVLEARALIDEAARVQAREEAARLKDDFLSSAAHDLKTPLTTLVAQAQLLERRATRQPGAPADLDGITRIVRESERLRDLVLELLDASRVEDGRLVGFVETVDLVEIAREICKRHDSARHPCLLDAEEPVVGDFDPLRIAQLVENLVENAVKYSPGGGEVRVRVWREGGEGRLSVTDQGIGIPADDLPHIFQRFHRGSNVDDRRFAGMGLGLFICRGIAEQHGGRIEVRSTPGRGTTFEVALPVRAEAGVPTS